MNRVLAWKIVFVMLALGLAAYFAQQAVVHIDNAYTLYKGI